MKIEDYEKLIKDASNPDTMPGALDEIIKNIRADIETYNSLAEASKELNRRIETLQETNTKLLLNQLGAKPEEKKEEEKKEMSMADFSHEL